MKLTHLDNQGRARMVDVSHKPVRLRRAAAEGCLVVSPAATTRKLLPMRNQVRTQASKASGIAENGLLWGPDPQIEHLILPGWHQSQRPPGRFLHSGYPVRRE